MSDGNASVMLLTDPEFGVSAQALQSGEPGSVAPAVGAPGDLRFELVPNAKEVKRGEMIVTAGTSTSTPRPRCGRCIRAASRSAWSRASRPARASWTA